MGNHDSYSDSCGSGTCLARWRSGQAPFFKLGNAVAPLLAGADTESGCCDERLHAHCSSPLVGLGVYVVRLGAAGGMGEGYRATKEPGMYVSPSVLADAKPSENLEEAISGN